MAEQSDDAEIRVLLRNNPMRGRVSISLEREPNYFADADILGDSKQTIVARENSRLVCVGSSSVRNRFVNGVSRRVDYLGGLRLDESCAGRFDILRRGYEFFRELQEDDPADFYFTSIASDNERARRFLQRGFKGMPKYEFVGEFVTLVLSTRRSSRQIDCTANDYGRRQFAPCWSREELGFRGIAPEGSVWDQRAFKQTVVRDYAEPIRRLRWIINVFNRLMGAPTLPRIGQPLSIAFGVGAAGHNVGALVRKAREIGLEMLVVGFDANDPCLDIVRKKFRGQEYRSRIYVVRWPGIGASADDLDRRLLGPEVALL
ncbi:MAG TPA: hypothetical protein VM680_04140 [Verrucomicrobiae bacterium]|nr:hypothetical protein [Verrucomicrobiae bacterium]